MFPVRSCATPYTCDTVPDPSEKAYLSILQWADAMDANAQVEALVACCAMDPFDADQARRRGVPQIVMRTDPVLARVMLEDLAKRGVLAFAPTRTRMQQVGDARLIRRLIPRRSGFQCEMWRGDAGSIAPGTVFCIIRARPRQVRRMTTDSGDTAMPAIAAMMPEAAFVEAAMGDSAATGWSTTRARVKEVLDIYLRDGSRLRIDADKFSFDCLGGQRAYADLVNMRLLTQMLVQRFSRALWDEGFGKFVCPPDILRDRVRGDRHATLRVRDDAPAFDFYSVWAYLMYRHLLPQGA